jgi:hypothetical protein
MPSFILLLEPGIDADIPLPSNIVNDLAMVTYAIIIEIDYQLARNIGALSTAP